MNFRDVWATDEEGNRFVFTVEMQRLLSEAGLPIQPESLAELDASPPKPAARQTQSDGGGRQSDGGKSQSDPPDEFEEPATIQIDPNTGKYIGRVKWYSDNKGYGFIARGGNEEIFFHRSDIACEPTDLQDGTWVLYDVEETKKGFEANDVELYQPD